MSICQVENFYDAIRRYKAKDAVLKRTKQEAISMCSKLIVSTVFVAYRKERYKGSR